MFQTPSRPGPFVGRSSTRRSVTSFLETGLGTQVTGSYRKRWLCSSKFQSRRGGGFCSWLRVFSKGSTRKCGRYSVRRMIDLARLGCRERPAITTLRVYSESQCRLQASFETRSSVIWNSLVIVRVTEFNSRLMCSIPTRCRPRSNSDRKTVPMEKLSGLTRQYPACSHIGCHNYSLMYVEEWIIAMKNYFCGGL